MIRAGMHGHVLPPQVAGGVFIVADGIVRRDLGAGGVDVRQRDGNAAIPPRIGRDAAPGLILGARTAGHGDEHVVGVRAAIQEDADQCLVVVARPLRGRRAHELHVRQGVHRTGDAETGTAGLHKEVAPVRLAAIQGLAKEEIHGGAGRAGFRTGGSLQGERLRTDADEVGGDLHAPP